MCANGCADAVEQQDRLCDQGSNETQFCAPPEDPPQRPSTEMEGKRMMITVHPASPVPLEKPRVPVRVRTTTLISEPLMRRISIPVGFLKDFKQDHYLLAFE